MADAGSKKGKRRGAAADEAALAAALATGLPAAMFTGPGLMALADLLPVMTAYVDREARYRFMNKALAEWLELPRARDARQDHGRSAGRGRVRGARPMFEAALAGERQFFAADLRSSDARAAAAQSDYVPWVDPRDRRRRRGRHRRHRRHRAALDRTGDARERGAVPPDRQFRPGDDVGDPARPRARFRQRPLCRVRRRARATARKRGRLDWRTRIHPDDVERIVAESIAGEATLQPFTLEGRYLRADGEYRWLRSVSQPRFGPTASWPGSSGWHRHHPRQGGRDRASARRSRSGPRSWRVGSAVPRGVRGGAGSDGAAQARRHRDRGEQPAGGVARIRSRARRSGTRLWEAPTMRRLSAARRADEEAASPGGGAVRCSPAEVRMEREGKPAAYLDVSVQPVRGPGGNIIYLLFEARDITELKTAQEQLRQSQKMEALGQLTGGIAHDFNNLLTVVVGGLDIIAKRAEDPKLKSYAENALAAAERGARLTGQLLAFSRVQRLEVRPTFVAPLIQNMRPLLRNVLGPGIEKRFDLDDAMMPVMADPTQLEVAVLNLAINARDAMPEGGVLSFASQPGDGRPATPTLTTATISS